MSSCWLLLLLPYLSHLCFIAFLLNSFSSARLILFFHLCLRVLSLVVLLLYIKFKYLLLLVCFSRKFSAWKAIFQSATECPCRDTEVGFTHLVKMETLQKAMKDLQFRHEGLVNQIHIKYGQRNCCLELTAFWVLFSLFREKSILGMLTRRDGFLVLFSTAILLLRFQADILQAKSEGSSCWALVSLAPRHSPCLLP